jgi:hypothetical protein
VTLLERKNEIERKPFPVAVEHRAFVLILATGVDLNKLDVPMKVPELLIDWKRGGVANKRLDQQLPLNVAIGPFSKGIAIACAKPVGTQCFDLRPFKVIRIKPVATGTVR